MGSYSSRCSDVIKVRQDLSNTAEYAENHTTKSGKITTTGYHAYDSAVIQWKCAGKLTEAAEMLHCPLSKIRKQKDVALSLSKKLGGRAEAAVVANLG